MTSWPKKRNPKPAPKRSKSRVSKKPAGPQKPPEVTAQSSVPSEGSKLELLVSLLGRAEGATVIDMSEATGWQHHSVRGALAGALKKKGHVIRSEKVDGVRRYRIEAAQ